MVQFGNNLERSRKEEWAVFYLDYKGLKERLKELKHAYEAAASRRGNATQLGDGARSAVGVRFALRRQMSQSLVLSNDGIDLLEQRFGAKLDAEVEKVVLFFLHQQGQLANQLLEVRSRSGCDTGNLVEYGATEQQWGAYEYNIYQAIGWDIAELMRFLELNVMGLRKILKKHDKQIRDKLLAEHYLTSRARIKYSPLQQLYHNEGIMALVGSLRNAFAVLEFQRTGGGANKQLPRTVSSLPESEDVLAEIAAAQAALAAAQQRTVQDYLAFSSDLLLEQGVLESEDDKQGQRELDLTSAILNLATTFLYMSNYYVVGPTSTQYAEALGGSPAISGLIIGMTPVASCVSALVYSWWTNWAFKPPLMLCGVMLMAGNLMYGMALTYDAFWMVMVGRALIGLGGARGVNRRYIADTIPIESRTSFSAAFVAVGAVGMAFGPFLAAVLSKVDFTLGPFIFNLLTLPGWAMFVLWAALTSATQLFFKEPTFRFQPAEPSSKLAAEDGEDDNRSEDASVTSSVNLNLNVNVYGSTATTAAPTMTPAGGSGGSLSDASAAAVAFSGETSKLLEAQGGGSGEAGAAEAVVQKSQGKRKGKEAQSGLGAITPPLAFCLWSYFVNKTVIEVAVSAAPVLTQFLFGWSAAEVGILMACMGLVVLPTSAIVGRMSMQYEDRFLVQVISVVAVVGCLLILNLGLWPYTQLQYVAAVCIVFVSLQAHEGVIMSVTSKIIPAELARGTFNSGFLATEAGTFGRFVGDAAITAVGVVSLDILLNSLFLPAIALIISMMLAIWVAYPWLDV